MTASARLLTKSSAAWTSSDFPPGKWWYIDPRGESVAANTSAKDVPSTPLVARSPAAPFTIFVRTSPCAISLVLIMPPPSSVSGAMQVIIASATMSAYIHRKVPDMPMIDVYATAGTFEQGGPLAAELARTLMVIEGVPDIPMFRQNTAAFIHQLPADSISNVEGQGNYVRVQVLTNAGALDREKQLAVVSQFTDLVSQAANDPSLKERTWVLLTEAIEGGDRKS